MVGRNESLENHFPARPSPRAAPRRHRGADAERTRAGDAAGPLARADVVEPEALVAATALLRELALFAGELGPPIADRAGSRPGRRRPDSWDSLLLRLRGRGIGPDGHEQSRQRARVAPPFPP